MLDRDTFPGKKIQKWGKDVFSDIGRVRVDVFKFPSSEVICV